MKIVVLKGGEEAIPLAHSTRAGSRVTRASGAVALSGDGQRWVLVNVSPLVADLLAADARLLRHHGLPDASLRAVVLTDAQVDHVTGLLSLRDGVPIHLYATPAVFEELTQALRVLLKRAQQRASTGGMSSRCPGRPALRCSGWRGSPPWSSPPWPPTARPRRMRCGRRHRPSGRPSPLRCATWPPASGCSVPMA